jgi:hypothetical protein
MFKYEEYKTVKHQVWGWVMIFAFSAILLGWCFFVHMMVPDVPRQWDFGQLDDTPASSQFSTEPLLIEPNNPLQIEPPILEKENFKK